MHGNVWEWCQDWVGDYSAQAVTDSARPDDGVHRVLRGGSWDSVARWARSAIRFRIVPVDRDNFAGFRFALGLARVSNPEAEA